MVLVLVNDYNPAAKWPFLFHNSSFISYHIISYHIISYHIISYHNHILHVHMCYSKHKLSQSWHVQRVSEFIHNSFFIFYRHLCTSVQFSGSASAVSAASECHPVGVENMFTGWSLVWLASLTSKCKWLGCQESMPWSVPDTHTHKPLCYKQHTLWYMHTDTYACTAGAWESAGLMGERISGGEAGNVSLWYSLSFAWKLCHAVRQQLGMEVTDSVTVWFKQDCCEFGFNLVRSVDTIHNSFPPPPQLVWLRNRKAGHWTQEGPVPGSTYLWH